MSHTPPAAPVKQQGPGIKGHAVPCTHIPKEAGSSSCWPGAALALTEISGGFTMDLKKNEDPKVAPSQSLGSRCLALSLASRVWG